MRRRPTDISLPGAVDLSGLRARAQQPPRPAQGEGAAAAVGGAVFDATEATFATDVVERSRDVPVVLDFWASWCGPCKQLSPVLEKLAAEANGAWVLAKVDCDAEQRLAAAFQVQSIPSVFAVIGGRPMPLFQGALPEQQVRQVLDEVLRVAAAAGVGAEPAGPPPDPAYDEAEQALARNDLTAAAAAYRGILDRDPGDTVAKTALARVELIARSRGVDERAVRSRAAADPDDLDAQLAVADLDVLAGQVADAFGRLVDAVRRTAGADRERVRQHLLELFEVVDPEDPRLAKARRDLANALF